MKNFLLAIILFCLFSQCTKHPFNDLGGNAVLKGVALLYDTLSGSYSFRPLTGISVYISDSTDSNFYPYSTKTDALGQFSFNGFDASAKYFVYAYYDTNQIHYKGKIVYHGTGGDFTSRKDSLCCQLMSQIRMVSSPC
jgi:hypothetical protein